MSTPEGHFQEELKKQREQIDRLNRRIESLTASKLQSLRRLDQLEETLCGLSYRLKQLERSR